MDAVRLGAESQLKADQTGGDVAAGGDNMAAHYRVLLEDDGSKRLVSFSSAETGLDNLVKIVEVDEAGAKARSPLARTPRAHGMCIDRTRPALSHILRGQCPHPSGCAPTAAAITARCFRISCIRQQAMRPPLFPHNTDLCSAAMRPTRTPPPPPYAFALLRPV